jgi:hypothetical protein
MNSRKPSTDEITSGGTIWQTGSRHFKLHGHRKPLLPNELVALAELVQDTATDFTRRRFLNTISNNLTHPKFYEHQLRVSFCR